MLVTTLLNTRAILKHSICVIVMLIMKLHVLMTMILEQDNVPYLEINCTPKDNKYNVSLLNNSILFNLKYTDNYTLNPSL
jgi:hypothetical protein